MIRYDPQYRVSGIRHEGQTSVGVRGPAGPGLEFTWAGTRLGVRVAGQEAYQYVDLKGKEGPEGPEGPRGKTGPIGPAFTYEDFTPEQLLALVGPAGAGLEFRWDGTWLGVRVQGQTEYQYVDLRGKEGPEGPRGATGPIGPAFTYEDFTPEQLLALVGAPGVGIQDIQRTKGNGAPGTIDTYTVTLTDGTTYDFFVYNGKDGEGAGDMTADVYDPQGRKRDVFRYVDEMIEDIDVDVTADEVTFADGETFQQKYDNGKLRGPKGPVGPSGADGKQGPEGPDGPVGPAGYTPQRGVDYWTAEDVEQIVADAVAGINQATRLTALPASGTTLTANAEYRVTEPVGTYQFAFPAEGDVYVRFTTAATFAISFANGTKFLGGVPKFSEVTTYELMVRDGTVAIAEVGVIRYVEFLESTGTQYIRTHLTPPSNNLRVEIEFEFTSDAISQSLFGAQGPNNQFSLIPWLPAKGQMAVAVGNNIELMTTNIEVGRKYHFDFRASDNVVTWDIDGVRQSANYTGTLDTTYEPLLLTQNVDGNPYQPFVSGKTYRCKWWIDDIIVRDYRPCLDEAGVACMREEVQQEYVYNDGTGEFIAGSRVSA